MKPIKEHFEMPTDSGDMLRVFDYIDALEDYIDSLEKQLLLPDVVGQSEQLFCPYCGVKKSFKVQTDINSGIVCKNILCKGK